MADNGFNGFTSSSSGLTRGSSIIRGEASSCWMEPAAYVALDPRVKPEDDEVRDFEGEMNKPEEIQ